MDPTALVREYLDAVTPGRTQFDRVRALLADDFTLQDPLMSARSADDFVSQLRGFGASGPMRTTVEAVLGQGDAVAALTTMQLGATTIAFSQWFTVANGKIAALRVIYDPRPFLQMAAGSGDAPST